MPHFNLFFWCSEMQAPSLSDTTSYLGFEQSTIQKQVQELRTGSRCGSSVRWVGRMPSTQRSPMHHSTAVCSWGLSLPQQLLDAVCGMMLPDQFLVDRYMYHSKQHKSLTIATNWLPSQQLQQRGCRSQSHWN